jgi:hypothetical protein
MMALHLVGTEQPAARPTARDWSEARSRREVILRTWVVVRDLAQTWGDEGAAVVVMRPPLTRADVQSAFREVSEKFCVGGIDLCFDEQESGRLRAIFRAHSRSACEVGEESHVGVARA